jgi:fumarate reductase flavoprotein subunit
MKKAIAAVSLLLALAGCSSSSSSSASSSLFKAGTYTGTGKGHNGDVTVEVVFTDSEIKSVTIKSQTETAGISDGAISDIPDEIVKAQSTKVDTVSGATVTSNAIIDAVNDCITQAGADPDSLGK